MATTQTQLEEGSEERRFAEFDLECNNCGFSTSNPETYERHNRACEIPVDVNSLNPD